MIKIFKQLIKIILLVYYLFLVKITLLSVVVWFLQFFLLLDVSLFSLVRLFKMITSILLEMDRMAAGFLAHGLLGHSLQ